MFSVGNHVGYVYCIKRTKSTLGCACTWMKESMHGWESTLQHIATHCNILQHMLLLAHKVKERTNEWESTLQHMAKHLISSALQHTITLRHTSHTVQHTGHTLQYTLSSAHCSTLQHIAFSSFPHLRMPPLAPPIALLFPLPLLFFRLISFLLLAKGPRTDLLKTWIRLRASARTGSALELRVLWWWCCCAAGVVDKERPSPIQRTIPTCASSWDANHLDLCELCSVLYPYPHTPHCNRFRRWMAM